MMEIVPNQHPAVRAALQQALQQLPHYRALMFVSGNAARYFFQQLAAAGLRLAPTQRIWSPGPGTSNVLQQCGVPAAQIDQPRADALQFDSEALWSQVGQQLPAGAKLLIVRGSDAWNAAAAQGQGRTWLTEQLQARGVEVDFASVYERRAPTASAELLAHIQQLRAQSAVWLFSSSECVRHLQALQPAWSWQAHQAIATHPRIGQQATCTGFGHVLDCKPSVQAVAASIKSLHDHL